MASKETCGCCGISTPSVCQTLDEIEFERGIWYSAMHGDIDKVKEKLDKGTDPSQTDRVGYTALHYAARNGKESTCDLLLQRGAKVNAQTNGGATALHRASSQGHKNIVKLLLNHKADSFIRDSDGRTALHKAVEGKHVTVVKMLLDFNPELKFVKDNRGHIPLFYNDPECSDLLYVLQH